MRGSAPVRLRHRPGVITTPGRFVVRLPFPRPPVTANQRSHWAVKANAVRGVREVVAHLASGLPTVLVPVTVGIDWHVPDRRHRDVDNIAPTLKPAIDGLRDAGVLPEDHSLIVTRTWQRITHSDGWGIEIIVEET